MTTKLRVSLTSIRIRASRLDLSRLASVCTIVDREEPLTVTAVRLVPGRRGIAEKNRQFVLVDSDFLILA